MTVADALDHMELVGHDFFLFIDAETDRPRVVRIEGLDDSTQRYADLVKRSALATFNDKRCQPIKGLPAELYDVPGGWKSVPMGFKFPG